MKLNTYKRLIAAAALLAISASSHASLINTGVVTDTGTGIGNVNTVLTLQNNNQTGEASGSVIRSGTADATTGDAAPGASKNATYSFGELNVTSASQLEFVFNPVEPGEVLTNPITLESLILTIYTNDGSVLWNSGTFTSITFPTTETGTGRSGYLFALDALQAADAQQHVAASNRIGLAASLSGATGGPDTFFVGILDGEGPGEEVPEPGSVALLGLGMVGMAALRRRGRKA